MSAPTVERDLDAIAEGIAGNEARVRDAIMTLTAVDTELGQYATRYSETIAEINGYTPTGPFETLAQDRLEKFTAVFSAIRSAVQAAIAELPS